MAKLRYNRTFKNGMIGILCGVLLFGSVFVYSIVAKIQYDGLVSNMLPMEATVVDIDLEIHHKGPNEQELYITYEVDGIVYHRELKTDTPISFDAGRGAHYSVGDPVEIFYDPQNPEVIASPRSVGVGYFYMIISLIGLALVSVGLFYTVKHSREFLVTQEEYEKEKEERKKSKSARKEQKKKKKAKAWRIVKAVLILLAALVGALMLFHLFRGILMGLGN